MAYEYVGPVAKDSGTGNLPIYRIVIHCTAGSDGKGARGTARYFRMATAKGSAHAVLDAAETLICAYDNVVCWHAPPNSHSYGVEICCSLSSEGKGHWGTDSHQAMLRRAAKLTAEKCLQHKIPVRKLTVAQVRSNERGICGHVDVSKAFSQSSHWDPGPYFPWTQFMALVADEYKKLTHPAQPPVQEDDEMTPAQMQDIKNYITSELTRFFLFLEKPNGNIDQQLAATEAVVQELVESGDTDVKNYMAAVSGSIKDYLRQTDNESEILAAVSTLAQQVAALTAKVDALPKA